MTQVYNYSELLLSENWKSKRREILARDGNKCKSCGAGHNLEVHHRQYHINGRTGIKYMPWNYENKLLITLCRPCHQAGHKSYKIPVFIVNA